MRKKPLIFIIILAILLIFYFVYNYFTPSVVKAPAEKRVQFPGISTSTNLKAPIGPPSIKGPTGPPPDNEK